MKIRLPNSIKKSFDFVYNFIQQIENHHIFLLSAAITFNIILYTIPLILVSIFVATRFIDKKSFTELIANLLFSFLPETEGTYFFVSNLLLEIDNIFRVSAFAGWIGVFFLLWLSSTVFSSLRGSLNVVFNAKSNKIFVFYKLKDIILTIVLSIFILLLTYLMPLIEIINKFVGKFLPLAISLILSKMTMQVFWIVLYFIFFIFVYKFIPSRHINFKIIIIASAICTVLSEIARMGFTFYLQNFASYSKFYGTYGLIVSILIWIYYLIFIILFSAELTLYVFPNLSNTKKYASD
ncbi:MAG: YihY/virulence factor BrkB family protein [Candidatus Kapaibacteriota bacterium]